MSESHVKIASELYSARNSMRILFPDVFEKRCRDWQDVIKRVSVGAKISEIEALLDVLGKLKGEGMTQIWVMAAYVEMVEPTVYAN